MHGEAHRNISILRLAITLGPSLTKCSLNFKSSTVQHVPQNPWGGRFNLPFVHGSANGRLGTYSLCLLESFPHLVEMLEGHGVFLNEFCGLRGQARYFQFATLLEGNLVDLPLQNVQLR